MKKLVLSIAFFTLAGLAACQNRSAEIETLGPPNTCLVQLCNNTEYNQYAGVGFGTYDYSANMNLPFLHFMGIYGYGQASTFCGCPASSIPVYHPVKGLGCIHNYYLQQSGVSTIFWTILSMQQQFTPFDSNQAMPYVFSQQQVYNPYGNCTNFVAEACLVNQPGSCRTGRCQPSTFNSGMGYCVR